MDLCFSSMVCLILHILLQSCSAGQEEDGREEDFSSMTLPMKMREDSVLVIYMENFRKMARRAAGCRKMMRDQLMNMTNPGNGKKTTSPKLLQV